MNYRTQDVIVWDDLPHPDPRARHPRISVRAAAPFWGRLRQHLREAFGGASQSAPSTPRAARPLWEQWLTADAIDTAVRDGARTTATGTDSVVPGIGGGRHRRKGDEALPAPAVRRLRDTLAASLEQPLALCFEPGATFQSRPTLYYLVLRNGASVVLTANGEDATDGADAADRTPTLDLDDCFFSWAAVEACGLADADSRSSSASSSRSARQNRRSAASSLGAAGALLCFGSAAFLSHDPGTAGTETEADVAKSIDNPTCRKAVVRELVRRYAVADEGRGFVLSSGNAPAHSRGTESGQPRMQFLRPDAWGFSGRESGSRWTGYPAQDSSSAGSPASRGGRLSDEFDAGQSDPSEDRSGKLNGTMHRGFVSPAGADDSSLTPEQVVEATYDGRENYKEPENMNGKPGPAPAYPPLPAHSRLNLSLGSSYAADLFSCRAELNEATERTEYRSLAEGRMRPASGPAASRADVTAYRAASAMGRCRVFGVAEGDYEGSGKATPILPPAAAVAAGEELGRRLARWTTDAERLRSRMSTLGGAAADDVRLGLYEARMQSWTAYLSIDESYSAAVHAGDEHAERLSEVVDDLLARIEGFDTALEHGQPCLAPARDAQLLANWRTMLAGPFRDVPPWWLDQPAEAQRRAATDADL